MRTLLAAIGLAILGATYSQGHSGRTDANGGHYDRSTGIYHCHTCPTPKPPTPPATNAAPQELVANLYAGVWIKGKIGQVTSIEYRENVQADWKHLATVTISSGPQTIELLSVASQLWIDMSSASHQRRFYRTIVQPQ